MAAATDAPSPGGGPQGQAGQGNRKRPFIRDDIAVALIAALAALVGTLVGGIVTYETNKSLQNRQLQQEEKRQGIAAEAVARLLVSQYHHDADRLQQMIVLHEYDPSSYREHTFIDNLSQEDRKLLASRLTEQDWSAIAEASEAIETVQSELEVHRGRGHIGTIELEELQTASSICKAAYTALMPVAEGKAI